MIIGNQLKTSLRRQVRPLRKHTFLSQAQVTKRGIYSVLQASLSNCNFNPSDPREAGESFSLFILKLHGNFAILNIFSRGCFI